MTQEVSLKQIDKVLHFSLKTVKNFSNSKPRTPGQKKAAQKPDSPSSENMKSTGVAWSKITENTHLWLVFPKQSLIKLATSFLWLQNSIDQAVS